jgi:penicillin amidase
MLRTALHVAASTLLVFSSVALAQPLAGLQNPASIAVDVEGIPHVRAVNEHDLYFMQGWVHARERLFQMDYNRRLASGTLAELVGSAALASDVQMRTLGLRRAAERSFAATSPRTRAVLQAYAQGVNAWIAAHALPPEYGALELTEFGPAWEPQDSIVVGKLLAFLLSFELDTARTVAVESYKAAGAALGFNGVKLFHDDLWRSAGFEPNATVPDAQQASVSPRKAHPHAEDTSFASDTIELAREHLDAVRDIPVFRDILERTERGGSNLWAVSGALTQHGRAMIANDPHLPLGMPSTFMPMSLSDGAPVSGSTVPGVPGVVHGYNSLIAWGTTNNLVDVTDTFSEQVAPDPTSPSGLSTVHVGPAGLVLEPLIPIPQVFRTNVIGNGVPNDRAVVAPPAVPPVVLVMPRRDGGPIIQLNQATGAALSVQYVGFGPTQEIEAFLLMNRARNLAEFTDALQRLDVGSQNFVYGDVDGNIAYFTTGEIPVREDLQAGALVGAAPWFIRNGRGGNEWLKPAGALPPNQATPRVVLPFSELPKVVNPAAGYLVNANNDPSGITRDNNPLEQACLGCPIKYMAYAWNRGFRAARIDERLRETLQNGNRRVSFKEMQAIQADVILRDAQVLTPYIVAAFDRARLDPAAAAQLRALGADLGVAEAVGRLRGWDGSTPTGIPQGYDASDHPGELQVPSEREVQASVAATIYAAWRARILANVVDGMLSAVGLPKPIDEDGLTALRNLLDHFDINHGIGASGVNFFAVPGIADAADRRDFLILLSMRQGLDNLRGPAFSAAFGGSANQNDYRWGLLHRVVIAHPLAGPFSVPPAGGAFPPPVPGLRGIPVDGGFQTVDAATHNARGTAPDHFMFDWGPNHRTVVELRPGAIRAESIWPGGTSGVIGSPNYFQFLERWLTNEAVPLSLGAAEGSPLENYTPVP